MRFISEIFREPDIQLGVFVGFSMGQILSFLMLILGVIVYYYRLKKYKQIIKKI